MKKQQNSPLRVASRTSNLALRQVEEVFASLPGLTYEIIPVQSYGDKHKNISLINNTIADFFTRELDEAILSGQADVAVHSAKDLPYPLPQGLQIIALTAAFDKSDAIVSKKNVPLNQLPANPRIGTSSLMRQAELMKLRPDAQMISIRGTIEERIAQVDNEHVDAAIVATCALKRLGLNNRIAEVLPFDTHPLQGHLAIVAKAESKQLNKTFEFLDIKKNYGKVWLVGFGPGNPDLLTVKGLKLLRKCDIILYDDLLDHSFLNKFKAEKIYVGKRKGNHSHEQVDINQLLLKHATSGKNVVRLKGGDPMIFGHGGEEVEFLRRNLVEVNVVPGITTALAAAAATGIPLTHRGISSSVTLMTGHSIETLEVPTSGTLVYYMAAANLVHLATKAVQTGWHPDTPVLLAHQVSGKGHEEYYTTLKEVVEQPKTYKTPLIIIIGNVVGLKHSASESLQKPSFLVTGNYPEKFAGLGDVIHSPVIRIKPLDDYSNISPVIQNLKKYQWIVLTSRYAVQYFFEALRKQNLDTHALAGLKIASIGKTTSEALLRAGIIADLQPDDESSEGLIELFRDQRIIGQNILFPRSNLGLPDLPKGLKELGNNVDTLTVYENVPASISADKHVSVDYVVFSSPSCVDNYFKIYPSADKNQKYVVKGKPTYRKLVDYKIDPAKISFSAKF